MRLIKCIWILIGFALTACGSTSHLQQPGHNSRNSLDWSGTYKGVLPCASCPGIETLLTLAQDGRYSLRTRYQLKESQTREREGEFRWNAAGNGIRLLGIDPTAEPTQYLVQENRLLQLNLKGQRITGALADLYVLRKVMPMLAGPEWQLVEIQGEAVIPGDGVTPYIQFAEESQRASGHSGCNRFSGAYRTGTTTTGLTSLTFSALISTRMACLSSAHNALEQKFTTLLQQVDTYALRGSYLVLFRGDEVLLRFNVGH